MAGLGRDAWDAAAAVRRRPVRPWAGRVFRYHKRTYAGDDARGSLRLSGRYNRGLDAFPETEAFPVLYTATSPHIALAERVRHTDPVDLDGLSDQWCTHLDVSLQRVLVACASDDCLDLAVDGVTTADFCRDYDYSPSQAFAAEARRVAEAIVVPSCTRIRGGNLIVFPDCLDGVSFVRVVEVETPALRR